MIMFFIFLFFANQTIQSCGSGGGQRFIENSYNKIIQLQNLIETKNSSALIEVDGGVNLDNAKKLYNCGANVLVAGNSVFSSPNPVKTISQIKGVME